VARAHSALPAAAACHHCCSAFIEAPGFVLTLCPSSEPGLHMRAWSQAFRPLAAAAGAAALSSSVHRRRQAPVCSSAPLDSKQDAITQLKAQFPAIDTLSLTTSSSGKKNIAVLGGSFDPVTNSHVVSASEIIHAGCADEVWIVPCGPRPDKPDLRTSYAHRLQMCHLAVNTTFGAAFPVKVCDIEMLEDRAMATYDLMQKLHMEYPDKEFSFVIGSDLWADLGSWDQGKRMWWLLLECRWLVFNRPNHEMPKELPKNFQAITPLGGTTLAHQELSSKEIRTRIRAGAAQGRGMADGLVPPSVLAHIIRYGLYDDEEGVEIGDH